MPTQVCSLCPCNCLRAASGSQHHTQTRWSFVTASYFLSRCIEGQWQNKDLQHNSTLTCGCPPSASYFHLPEVMPSPRLIWAKSAEREAESSVLELVGAGAGGGGGPGGGGAAPAGGADGDLAPSVATGPCKRPARGKAIAQAPYLLQ